MEEIERLTRRWVDNIETNFGDTGRESVN